MYKYTFIVLLALLSFGCLDQPSNDKVCPDGKIIDINHSCSSINFNELSLNPEDYASTTLNPDQMNYAKALGSLNTTFNLKNDEQASVDFAYVLDNSTFFPMNFYYVNPKAQSALEYKLLGADEISVSIPSPSIPGKYLLFISKRNLTGPDMHVATYNLTVINQIQNESQAYAIAEFFMLKALRAHYGTPSHWNVYSYQSSETGDKVTVVLAGRFDVCGVDWEANDCVRGYTAVGNFTISKKTGQIIG
jgi:hypothetical protein